MKKDLLKAYIRELINEMAMEDVETSSDPLDWITAAYQSPEEWESKTPFEAMLKALSKFGLKQIGEGSSRLVFELDGNSVVKLAKDEKGLAQNELEVTAGRDPQVESIISGVLDYDPEFYWVVSKKVIPLHDAEVSKAEKIIGVPWNEVRKTMGLSARSEYDATAPVGGQKSGVTQRVQLVGRENCMTGNDFLSAISSFMERYKDMLPGDLAKLSSWGITGEGCLVLLDYGITTKKFRELYKQNQ